MRRLFEMDLKDYNDTDNVFRRPSARAIILKGDKIALVYSKKEKYYKFPGGGIHVDEDKKEALIREVREEAGLVVIPETITEYGSVLRRQKSTQGNNTIFEQENYYYFCDVEDGTISQELDDYENEARFVLQIVSLDEAITTNSVYATDDFSNEIMIKREKQVLELLKQELECGHG
ncbi:MAG: NUDIX domain-containing protein [Clostridiales bacterium]|nr:NUDIX domain-containing protein [Clostridiales bacterium]